MKQQKKLSTAEKADESEDEVEMIEIDYDAEDRAGANESSELMTESDKESLGHLGSVISGRKSWKE